MPTHLKLGVQSSSTGFSVREENTNPAQHEQFSKKLIGRTFTGSNRTASSDFPCLGRRRQDDVKAVLCLAFVIFALFKRPSIADFEKNGIFSNCPPSYWDKFRDGSITWDRVKTASSRSLASPAGTGLNGPTNQNKLRQHT